MQKYCIVVHINKYFKIRLLFNLKDLATLSLKY